MKKVIFAAAMLGAVLSLNACKLEDVFKKPAMQDPVISGLFSGQQALEYTAGKMADVVAMPIPRSFYNQNINLDAALFMPQGTDKVPVIIILHGAGGLHQHEVDYAKTFLNMGIATLLIDSYTKRGVNDTHGDDGQITPRSMALDAATALSFLSMQPRIDMSRVGVMGFDKGGMGAHLAALRSVLDATPAKDHYTFKMHMAVYPLCHAEGSRLTTNGAPIYMMLGSDDPYAKACQAYAEKLKDAGATIFLKTYAGAKHAWDENGVKPLSDAENYSNCNFVQEKDHSWSERTSGATGIIDMLGPNYDRALMGCVTRGLDQQFDTANAAATIADIKALAEKDLLQTQPLLVPKAEPAPVVQEKPKAPAPKKKRHR
jgi:dienelactone hydrolase